MGGFHCFFVQFVLDETVDFVLHFGKLVPTRSTAARFAASRSTTREFSPSADIVSKIDDEH